MSLPLLWKDGHLMEYSIFMFFANCAQPKITYVSWKTVSRWCCQSVNPAASSPSFHGARIRNQLQEFCFGEGRTCASLPQLAFLKRSKFHLGHRRGKDRQGLRSVSLEPMVGLNKIGSHYHLWMQQPQKKIQFSVGECWRYSMRLLAVVFDDFIRF